MIILILKSLFLIAGIAFLIVLTPMILEDLADSESIPAFLFTGLKFAAWLGAIIGALVFIKELVYG